MLRSVCLLQSPDSNTKASREAFGIQIAKRSAIGVACADKNVGPLAFLRDKLGLLSTEG